MQRSTESSCPWLRRRFNLEVRGRSPSEDNACALWSDVGVPPDVVQYCSGQPAWRGEPCVPISVETQYSVCLTEHYGTCRWLHQRRWHTREVSDICPYLGSAADRHHKYLFPCEWNVCHAEESIESGLSAVLRQAKRRIGDRGELTRSKARGRKQAVSAEKQQSLCLTQRYQQCELYQQTL